MRFRELVETPIDENRPLRKLLLPSVPAATASTILTASAGSIGTYHRVRARDGKHHAGWRLSRIGEPRSTVALDGGLDA
jgi:hypothetical protein